MPGVVQAKRGLVALVAGALYALAFPPLDWGFLILPGLAGLMWCARGCSVRGAWYLGLAHGLVAYGLGLSWLLSLFGVFALVLWTVMAVFHGLFAAFLARAFACGWTQWFWAAFAAVNWLGFEFLRGELFPLKFPWMTVGTAIGPNALLPVVGVYVVGSLVALLVGCGLCRMWKPSIILLCLLMTSVAMFRKRPALSPRDPGVVMTAGIQLEAMMLEDHMDLTRKLPGDVRYVLWPEYAVAHDIRRHPKDWPMVRGLCKDQDITLTFGTRDDGDGHGWKNIALTIDESGERGIHNKIHTVHFFDDGAPGTVASPVNTRHGPVGTPICFDCDYEGVTRRMTAAGAEMFMVPVMDAISWTRRQHEQHGELFRIRAAENGRWMFVCATSGASMVIDPHGHVHERLPAMEQGVLVGMMARETWLTPYTRGGWIVPWGLLGTAVMMWISLLPGLNPWLKKRICGASGTNKNRHA